MSWAGGPVGKGLGTFVCLPFFLAYRQEGDCPAVCVTNAAVDATEISVRIAVNCFMVVVDGDMVGVGNNSNV